MFSIYSTLLACGLGIKSGFRSVLLTDETADVKVLPDHKYSLKPNLFCLEAILFGINQPSTRGAPHFQPWCPEAQSVNNSEQQKVHYFIN